MSSTRPRRASVVEFVDRAFETLVTVDYYTALGVDSSADEEQIRAAYYQLARRLHPDVHGEQADTEFRRKLTAVFSRVVESYRVLSNPELRKDYDRGLAEGRVRWDARAHIGRDMDPGREIASDGARKFFRLARSALQSGELKSAVMNLRLALQMEPDSRVIREALADAEARLHGGG